MQTCQHKCKMMRLIFLVVVLAGVGSADPRACRRCGQGGSCCSTLSYNPFEYVFTIPITSSSGTRVKACITLHRNEQSEEYELGDLIRMRVSLNAVDGSLYYRAVTIATTRTSEKCFNILMPSHKSGENRIRMAYAKLLLTFATRGRLHQMDAEQKIFIFQTDEALSENLNVFISTDKSSYNPGQTVLFRVLQLKGVHPTSYKVEKITISDSDNRKIMVLNERSPTMGLVSDKLELIAEPNLGQWSILVDIAGIRYSTYFSVEEYVLPKFEALIDVPKFVPLDTDPFPVKICLKYVHGNPVDGTVSLSVSTLYSDITLLMNELSTDLTGCVNDTINLEGYESHELVGRMKVTVIATDNLSGEMVQAMNEECEITSSPFVIDIINQQRHFKYGIPYEFEIFYHDIAGNPISEQEIIVEISSFQSENVPIDIFYLNTTTNNQGRSRRVIPTSQNISFYEIKVYDKQTLDENQKIIRPSVAWRLQKIDSIIPSSIDIDKINTDLSHCGQPYNLTGKAVVAYFRWISEVFPTIAYQVKDGNKLIHHGLGYIITEKCEYVFVNNETQHYLCNGRFSMTLDTHGWSKRTNILVYIVHEGFIAADDVNIDIPASCLTQKVRMTINKKTARPGEDIVIGISDQPNSLCALTIRDKSVHLLGVDNDIKEDKIKPSVVKNRGELAFLEFTRLCDFFDNFDNIYSFDDDGYLDQTSQSFNFLGPEHGMQSDELNTVPQIFQKLKLALVTNTILQDPICVHVDYGFAVYDYYVSACEGCNDISAIAYDIIEEARVTALHDIDEIPEVKHEIAVRNFFPETWRWDLLEIGHDGFTIVSDKLPDTITEWIASAYCISQEFGIGFSPQVSIDGFKPIFLEVSMPYSVIRGEEFTLKTILHNYFDEDICLEMVITLDESENFALLDAEPVSVQCVCGGEMRQIKYNIKPISLGEVRLTLKTWSQLPNICGSDFIEFSDATDGVERILLVESEGIEVENTRNDFVCLNESGPSSIQFSRSILIPEDHYKDSDRVLVNIIGSIMGPVLDNLDHLIQAPFGCGEQNMITMVPNIVVHKYLTAVGKMTSKMKEKIEKNILMGYQRELNYQRRDGSFSAFGNQDDVGSSWLTAFVISTFEEASQYIAIDEVVVESAKYFLQSKAWEGNCFKRIGLVHHKDMMGGADGPNALDAYIKLAMRKSNFDSNRNESVYDIYGCDGSTDLKVYTRAIKFYTNALRGRENAANYLWDTLKQDARFEDGDNLDNAQKIFWSDEEDKEETVVNDYQDWWYYEKPSDAVEVTSYVLLGYLKMEERYPNQYPILRCYPIVQWLTSQRNARGSFSSTQNTVLGLTALSEYATRTLASTKLSVIINDGKEDAETFEVNDDNNIVLQQSLIKPSPSAVTYTINGYGCALIQTNTKFNTPEEPTSASFSVSVHVHGAPGGCDKPNLRQLIVCAVYQGNDAQPSSNMAVFEISMVSGYRANKNSLKAMADANVHNGLKRYEIDGKKVNIYFEEISSERKCAAFEVEKDGDEVKNPQPGLVHVFDYYDPVKSTTIKYNLSCVWETYNDKIFAIDCLLWDVNGHCRATCAGRRGSACVLYDAIEEPVDFCSRGDLCGRNGDCINTGSFFRCSCHPGWQLVHSLCHPKNMTDQKLTPSATGVEEISCLSGFKLAMLEDITYCEVDDGLESPHVEFTDKDLSPGCPSCWENFPHPSNFSHVFCPKHNVFIGSMLESGLYNLKPVIKNGAVIESNLIPNINFGVHATCKCPLFRKSKFYLITTNDITNQWISIADSKIIPKRSWRKLRDYECP